MKAENPLHPPYAKPPSPLDKQPPIRLARLVHPVPPLLLNGLTGLLQAFVLTREAGQVKAPRELFPMPWAHYTGSILHLHQVPQPQLPLLVGTNAIQGMVPPLGGPCNHQFYSAQVEEGEARWDEGQWGNRGKIEGRRAWGWATPQGR